MGKDQFFLRHPDWTYPCDSFVYDRKFGVIPVIYGYHSIVMATLFAFHKGFLKSIELNMDSSYLSDEYIKNIHGTAFLSSVSRRVLTWSEKRLNAVEKRTFIDVTELSW